MFLTFNFICPPPLPYAITVVNPLQVETVNELHIFPLNFLLGVKLVAIKLPLKFLMSVKMLSTFGITVD